MRKFDHIINVQLSFILKKCLRASSRSNFESYLPRLLWLDSNPHHRVSNPHFSGDGPLKTSLISAGRPCYYQLGNLD